jgi:3-oxoacyl-[acyl-carrier protein] reductase
VTGAGDNICRAVALAFAAAGTHVAVNVRENKRAADDVTREAIDRGVRAIAVVGDVSDPDADDAIVAQVRDALGPIDIFVHCVGVRPLYPIAETPIEEWRRVMDTNCSSYFYLARLVLPSMGERGFGRLIAMGGADASQGSPTRGSIAASKAALTAVTKAVAVEFGACGVTANIVSPTITETTASEHLAPEKLREMLPIPRPARLDEIAFACLYLASDEASYVTGQTLRVDGGFEV